MKPSMQGMQRSGAMMGATIWATMGSPAVRAIAIMFAVAIGIGGTAPSAWGAPPYPKPTKPDEPPAAKFAPLSAAGYLDGVALQWTRERKCATCHTNVPYMLARPLIAGGDATAMAEIRTFYEKSVAEFAEKKPNADYKIVATAVGLAFHDSVTTKKLQPITRQALDMAWTVQRSDGSWKWPDCDWPPLEHDQFYSVAYMAVAVSIAPDNYRHTPAAKAGLEKMRAYLKKESTTELHHRATLLWASKTIDGLISDAEKKAVVEELRKLQRPDGGWNLPSLGPYDKRHDGTKNDLNGPGDGYGTGFAVFILRQAGVAADDPAIQKGIKWIKENQRESGRWFTRSPRADRAHYVTNVGCAFAVLALHSCGVKLE